MSADNSTSNKNSEMKEDVRFCEECEDAPAQLLCPVCKDIFCALCFTWLHRNGNRKNHQPTKLDGTPLDVSEKPDTLEGTTEHFVAQLNANMATASNSVKKTLETKVDNGDDEDLLREPILEDQEQGKDFAKIVRYIPLRLTSEERTLLSLLEGVLKVSEYTDNVDVSSSVYGGGYGYLFGGGGVSKKVERMRRELNEFFSVLCGLVVVNDYKRGSRLVRQSVADNAEFFQRIFEIGRRFKIMNPDKLRTTYGKLMHILQDAVTKDVLNFDVVIPIKTVYTLLKQRACARDLLCDPNLPVAIAALGDAHTPDEHAAAVRRKAQAKQRLIERYAGPNGSRLPRSNDNNGVVDDDVSGEVDDQKPAKKQRSGDDESTAGYGVLGSLGRMIGVSSAPTPYDALTSAGKQAMSSDELELVLASLADAESHRLGCQTPVDDMLHWLDHYFGSTEAKNNPKRKLAISYGSNGSKLSHSHSQQYQFVRQSLMLWREVQRQMFRLWICADKDMLSPSGYRLVNTGQGLNRVQAAPNVSSAMANILGSVKSSVGAHWVGLSVVHLGDRDVPNALFFIDKYTQVPRILAPIARTMRAIPKLAENEKTLPFLTYNVDDDDRANNISAIDATRVRILRSFFRFGFNGDGDDGGSCIDGRLTSAWNWCSKVEGKVFWNTFQLCGFTSFDGDFRSS